MISNIKIFLLCPVPEDQKPINEYIGLKENSLTNWTTLSKRNYQKKLFSFWSFFLVLMTLFGIVEVGIIEVKDWEMFFGNWFFLPFGISLNLFFFFLFINYVRWKQIKSRFINSRLFYEEASWYDGQIWEKPFSIIKNDRLVSTQKMRPILERLTANLFSLFFLGFLLFPIFSFFSK